MQVTKISRRAKMRYMMQSETTLRMSLPRMSSNFRVLRLVLSRKLDFQFFAKSTLPDIIGKVLWSPIPSPLGSGFRLGFRHGFGPNPSPLGRPRVFFCPKSCLISPVPGSRSALFVTVCDKPLGIQNNTCRHNCIKLILLYL